MKKHKKSTQHVKQKPAIRNDAEGNASGNFEVNPFYESLLEMRERKPEAFKNLSPVTRLAVEAYLKARQMSSAPEIREAAA